jgi:hypothetical protein
MNTCIATSEVHSWTVVSLCLHHMKRLPSEHEKHINTATDAYRDEINSLAYCLTIAIHCILDGDFVIKEWQLSRSWIRER